MYDLFYIGKKDKQFERLKSRFFTIKHVDSFEIAQKKCITKFFWCIWDDLEIVDNFKFDYVPDDYSQDVPHLFLNGTQYDGVALIPKSYYISKNEGDYKFFVSKKCLDIVASKPRNYEWYNIETYDDYLHALEHSRTTLFFGTASYIKVDEEFKNKTHEYNKLENHAFLHNVCGETKYDGVFLFTKLKPVTKREIEYRHIVHRKEWDIVASQVRPYDKFVIDSFDDYNKALKNTRTEMFWGTSSNIDTSQFDFDIYFNYRGNEFEWDRKENHAFIHRVDGEDYYNGLFLFSKSNPVTKREIEYRHLVVRKEWDIVASGPVTYDSFIVDTYEEYENAMAETTTELFYAIPRQVNVIKPLNVYFPHSDEYNRNEHHTFKNICNKQERDNGVFLLSTHKPLSKNELEHRHIVYKKDWNIIASHHKPYDVVFMSYDEEFADKHYADLLKKAPHATRVHGVKGIHQAHIQAAKQSQSEMVWIVDADAILMDDFDFELFVEKWDRETVHVWRSKNPINDLVYGYGGVKLFPRQLTIDMDISKPDMTTSITERFRAVPVISNITAFNVDEFSTWKSETNQRLRVWTTVGKDKPFGSYAIAGAKAGREYGERNKNNVEALRQINDFDWLKEQFEKY
jgi:hypothetical protein